MTAEQDAVIDIATDRFLLAIQKGLDTYRDAIKAVIQAPGATNGPLAQSAPGASSSPSSEPAKPVSVQASSAAPNTASSTDQQNGQPDPRPGWKLQLYNQELPGPLYIALCRAAGLPRGVGRVLTTKDIDGISLPTAQYIAVSTPVNGRYGDAR